MNNSWCRIGCYCELNYRACWAHEIMRLRRSQKRRCRVLRFLADQEFDILRVPDDALVAVCGLAPQSAPLFLRLLWQISSISYLSLSSMLCSMWQAVSGLASKKWSRSIFNSQKLLSSFSMLYISQATWLNWDPLFWRYKSLFSFLRYHDWEAGRA